MKFQAESGNPLPGLSTAPKVQDADPTRTVSVHLCESTTDFLLTIPSISVSSENNEEATFVKAQNAKYKELKVSNQLLIFFRQSFPTTTITSLEPCKR
jgi:hypothetical protein